MPKQNTQFIPEPIVYEKTLWARNIATQFPTNLNMGYFMRSLVDEGTDRFEGTEQILWIKLHLTLAEMDASEFVEARISARECELLARNTNNPEWERYIIQVEEYLDAILYQTSPPETAFVNV